MNLWDAGLPGTVAAMAMTWVAASSAETPNRDHPSNHPGSPSTFVSPQDNALAPVYRVSRENGPETLATAAQLKIRRLNPAETQIAFRAVVATDWKPGLVAVYALEKEMSFSLHRRPKRGLENTTEPLFFALPTAAETNAARLAGRWECEGTHADGAKDFFAWDLTVIGDEVVGRFDQNTDYRFAYVTGGTFQSNQLALHIDYISNRYLVTGRYEDERLLGTWEQTTGADHGNWTGTRPAFGPVPDQNSAVPLYEWRRRDAPDVRRYGIESPEPASAWAREEPALGRVWPATQ